ncbi:major facilitator superfamily domain-containing protein [Chaetomidium leptoderma]|uniref:Major facilitator superfamily domain-containing protein n=1 Tax=Chaetomidium leptoderma TaxID=669021 RepID=A0AAN6ZTY0_9PEZI|nr:major facilitator superfamily domain-containing protein [Chaetomidium leptoderma]
MESTHEPAEPFAKGVLATARQLWRDLFIFKQRVVVTNVVGETATEWGCPLLARDWLFSIVKLSQYYNTSITDVSTAITLTLLLRLVGAAFFGLAGDRWGRALQIATNYYTTFSQFLGVRSLFGLFMGGVYHSFGNAIAMSLENSPPDARGLISGILQPVAAYVNLGIGGSDDSWKTIFWVGAGLSIGVGIIRIFFPELSQFLEACKAGKTRATPAAFWKETKVILAQEWKIYIYCVILITWFNFYSHTSQDSYTTFMLEQKQLDNAGASRASILIKVGACSGRRRTIIVAAILSGLLIPAWILPEGERGLSASGFFLQFFVQGAWGVVPIHLNELSPPAFRSSFPGLTYQLGNIISSPSVQIVNAIAGSHFVTSTSGKQVDTYGPTIGIATAIIATGIAVTTALGPERRGREFEKTLPAGMNMPSEGKVVDLESGDTGDTKGQVGEVEDSQGTPSEKTEKN